MKKGLIGRKIGMTQVFDEKGKVIPVTVVELGPCAVVQKKTIENDGYAAVQLGFDDKKVTRTNKPEKGHFDKANVAPKKVLREFRFEDVSAMNVGDIIKADAFEVGEKASFLVRMLQEYDTSGDLIVTLFAVEDENGNIVEASTSEESWINMWYRNYCELDIPDMPDVPGDYTMYVYFNGALAGETAFTVISE